MTLFRITVITLPTSTHIRLKSSMKIPQPLNYAINQSAIGDFVEKMVFITYRSPDQNGAYMVDIFLRINPTMENPAGLEDQLGRMQTSLNELIYITDEVKGRLRPRF
ncbi:hypothetical protein AHF37_11977 [Paragonimus kellicotti]|nr:hypothetical protein AHF37_11977 [Paragonimus kellicotti]